MLNIQLKYTFFFNFSFFPSSIITTRVNLSIEAEGEQVYTNIPRDWQNEKLCERVHIHIAPTVAVIDSHRTA